ncbi:hypothetical protein [Aeromicrobium sp. 9AM]|uniref:hypothetical protein n=1 Tax=Aeromicrobium sp. 9AM TaxID=2653126 RepID=UPI0012EF0475|nr:hypothetical protein [Aeromicrobium sp. 9AM]VXB86412.1 conserved hypothetical protein [Aeromicrobium sp. 9AM]
MSDPSTSSGTDVPDETHDEPVDELAGETVQSTGHADIDAALERLDRLDGLEITAHPEEFDAIHRVLRESLANAGRDGDIPESA